MGDHGLSDDERARILFDHIDENNSGRLEYHEIAALVKQLEMKISRKNLDAAIAGMDKKGLGFVGFPAFAKWWSKQTIGYRLTKKYLWTPRGTRIPLDSPRLVKAMAHTGVAVHNMKAATKLELRNGNPTPEVIELRRKGMEKLRMENIQMVLKEREKRMEGSDNRDSKGAQAPVDGTDAKIAEMLAASTERVEQIMATQKAREAIAEAELKQMAEKTRERDARAREAEENFLRFKEEEAAKAAVQRRKREEKTAEIKAALAAKLERQEQAREQMAEVTLAAADKRARRIARKRSAEEKRKAAERERLAELKAKRVAAQREAAQLAREEQGALSVERDRQRQIRHKQQKEEEREAMQAKNNERRQALEQRLSIGAGDAERREKEAQRELEEKMREVQERNDAAQRLANQKLEEQRKKAKRAEAERARKAAERTKEEEKRIEEAKASLVQKEENVAKARHRALLVTQSKVEQSRLDALEKANYVERMQRIEAAKQAKMKADAEAQDVKTREWYAVRTSLKERQSKHMISLLLDDYRSKNPLYRSGGRSSKRSTSVPLGMWESKRGWDLNKPDPSGLSATGYFDNEGNLCNSDGRSEEEEQLRRRHKIGDRSEWKSAFLSKHGRLSLSPVQDDYHTLDARKMDRFGITGGRSNRVRQAEDSYIRVDRSKVFNQSWSVDID